MRGPINIYLAHIFLLRDFLDLGVAHEDWATMLEVEVFEGVKVLLLKPPCRFEPGLVDFGVECIDVSGTFLQGDGLVGYEVSRQYYGCGQRLEVCSFSYVKREYGVSSCDGKIWSASHVFMRSDSFCPKYQVYTQRPLLLVTIDNFKQ
jgi:hypothetical protein